MKTSLKTLIVVLLTVMSFAAAQADDCSNVNVEDKKVYEGVVCQVQYKDDMEPSKIWIGELDDELNSPTCKGDEADWLEIIGFPYGNLELQLNDLDLCTGAEEITIDEGDCVKGKYIEKTTPSGDTYNKWCSLEVFNDGLESEDCVSCPESQPETNDCCYETDSDNGGMTRQSLKRHGPPNKNHPGKNSPWNQEETQP